MRQIRCGCFSALIHVAKHVLSHRARAAYLVFTGQFTFNQVVVKVQEGLFRSRASLYLIEVVIQAVLGDIAPTQAGDELKDLQIEATQRRTAMG